ncbi:hypothetical protein IW262DRAFT_1342360 [Armillaria fumosa]|nr:hypothetical protein IW262DRAFT_1342360 [Armillaria fumosa]
MGDRYDVPSQRLQASTLLVRAAIPHVIWGQDTVYYSLSGSFFFFADVDVQILLPSSRIQQAVNLLAPTYAIMSHKEIVDEADARPDSPFSDYTLAFRDCPDDFARLKLMQQNSNTDPSHILLISNTLYDYPLHDVVQKHFPLCPELPFPSVPALIRLMPVLMQKRIDIDLSDLSDQNWSFISSCRYLLEAAINLAFPKELNEEFDNEDQLPVSLKCMMSGLDEKGWICDLFLIEGEPGGSDSDSEGIWDTLLTTVGL